MVVDMPTPPEYAEVAKSVGANVRAEMARHGKTTADLARALDVHEQTAGKRLSGAQAFDAVELVIVAGWLDVDLDVLWKLPERVVA